MPIFDPSTSRSSHDELEMLRGVLGPPRPVVTSLRVASRDHRRRQRNGRIMRALIVGGLAASFCGSAWLVREIPLSASAVATRVAPATLDPEATGSIDRSE